jgi:hypothetical protein
MAAIIGERLAADKGLTTPALMVNGFGHDAQLMIT